MEASLPDAHAEKRTKGMQEDWINTQPVGLQLAFLLLLSAFPSQSLRSCRGERWGGGKNVALSVLPGGLSNAVLRSDWPTITSLFPHLLENHFSPPLSFLLSQFLIPK